MRADKEPSDARWQELRLWGAQGQLVRFSIGDGHSFDWSPGLGLPVAVTRVRLDWVRVSQAQPERAEKDGK